MKVAFLIEGSISDRSKFKDLEAAIALAEANSAPIFDAIESYSPIHSAAVLKKLDSTKWPLYAMTCLVHFSDDGSPDDVIEIVIKPGFEQLLTEGLISELPTWLTELNSSTFGLFLQKQLLEHFSGSSEAFKIFSRELHATIIKESDSLSLNKFIKFLSENPDIDHVYALIGKNHLNFLQDLAGAEVLQSNENQKKLKIKIGSREIIVELYGGRHGEMEHFNRMQSSCRASGLTIPEVTTKTAPTMDVSALLRLLLLSSTSTPETGPSSVAAAGGAGASSFPYEAEKPRKKAVFNLNEAAERFDYWMKNYTHLGAKTNNQEFIEWLYADNGAELVSTYDEFCLLATKLGSMGYATLPPPLKTEFETGLAQFESRQRRRGMGFN